MEEEIVVNNEQQPQQVKPIEKKKTGLMITTIITTALALAFLIGTLVYIADMFTGDQTERALGFVFFLISYGWITYVPSLGLSIAGIITARFGLRSTNKANRVVCIIFLVLSSLILLTLVILGMVLCFYPYNEVSN